MNAHTLGRLLQSTVGLKVIMAVTGLVWIVFVFAHFVGNLLVYAGPEALNAYGHFIQEGSHGAVWVLRVTVAAALILHVYAMAVLTRRSAAARPEAYAGGRVRNRASYASLTMRYGGPALLLFVLYHLSHLTLGWTHPDFVYGDVYRNLVLGFQDPLVAGVYMAAMLFLGLHLYHGTRSLLQTVGLASMDSQWPAVLGGLLAIVVAGGNAMFPVAVLTGILELP